MVFGVVLSVQFGQHEIIVKLICLLFKWIDHSSRLRLKLIAI